MSSPMRLMKLPEVIAMTALSRTTIYRKMGEGSFPKPLALSPACVRWLERDIQAWITQFLPQPS
jgi:prophage regulatory protein